jgi:hypothetical protein
MVYYEKSNLVLIIEDWRECETGANRLHKIDPPIVNRVYQERDQYHA